MTTEIKLRKINEELDRLGFVLVKVEFTNEMEAILVAGRKRYAHSDGDFVCWFCHFRNEDASMYWGAYTSNYEDALKAMNRRLKESK